MALVELYSAKENARIWLNPRQITYFLISDTEVIVNTSNNSILSESLPSIRTKQLREEWVNKAISSLKPLDFTIYNQGGDVILNLRHFIGIVKSPGVSIIVGGKQLDYSKMNPETQDNLVQEIQNSLERNGLMGNKN